MGHSASQLRTSIALCTYNGAPYLREQLESIASQMLVPDELVICDDLSTDETIAIIQDFSRQSPFPVRLFQNEQRLGAAKNFERAIRQCEGDIVFLCDQDDIWDASKVGRMVETLEKHPEAVYVFSDSKMADETGKPLGETLWEAVGFKKHLKHFTGSRQLEILLKQNLIPGSSMAFRKSFRDIVLPIPDFWMHDYWIVLLGSLSFQGAAVSAPLYRYRRHAGQLCGWKKKTFSQVVGDSVASQGEESWQKLERFQELRKRLLSVSAFVKCPQACEELIAQKEAHLRKRAQTRSSKGLGRIFGVLAEAATGRYGRYSNSWYSILRDL